MTVPVIVLKSVLDAPADSTLLELTLRATDATPENIILYPRPSLAAAGLVVITLVAMGVSDSWPVFNQVAQGVEWYQDGVKYTGSFGAGSGVFPTEPDVTLGVVYGPTGADYSGTYDPMAAAVFPGLGDVDQGITFGPTGTDYTGTLQQPAVADVKSGVQYGADGTEFTGTLTPGTAGGGTVFLRRR